MKLLKCTDCKSTEINRISLYDYECEICGNVFDVDEADGDSDDWFPEDDEEDNND